MASTPERHETKAGESVLEPPHPDNIKSDHDHVQDLPAIKYQPRKFLRTGYELQGVGDKCSGDLDATRNLFDSNDNEEIEGIKLGPEDLGLPWRGASRKPPSLDVSTTAIPSLSSRSQLSTLESAFSSGGPTYSVPSIGKPSQSHVSGEESSTGSKSAGVYGLASPGPRDYQDAPGIPRLTSVTLETLQDPGLRTTEPSDWASDPLCTPRPWQECDFSWTRDTGIPMLNGYPLPFWPSSRQDSIISCPRSPSDHTVVPGNPGFRSPAPVTPTEWQRGVQIRTIEEEYVDTIVRFTEEVYLPTITLDDEDGSGFYVAGPDSHESESSRDSKKDQSSNDELGKKRKRRDGVSKKEAEGADDDKEDKSHDREKVSKKQREEVEGEHWVCPFYAWRPLGQNMGTCMKSWKKLSYVLGHLRGRVHRKKYCGTCFGQTEDELGNETPHGGKELGIECQISPQQPVLIIDKVFDELNPFPFTRTPVESWRHVFRLIFPSEEYIPSPFLKGYDGTHLFGHFSWVEKHLGRQLLQGVVRLKKADDLFYLTEEDVEGIAKRGFDRSRAIMFCINPKTRLKPIPLGRDSSRFALDLWKKFEEEKGNNIAANARSSNTVEQEFFGAGENDENIFIRNELDPQLWENGTLCPGNDNQPESEADARGCSGDDQQGLAFDWLKYGSPSTDHRQMETVFPLELQGEDILAPEFELSQPAFNLDGGLAVSGTQDSGGVVDGFLADMVRTSAASDPWVALGMSVIGAEGPWRSPSALRSSSPSAKSLA